MVWSTWIVADTYHSIKVKPEQRTIRVTGSAKKRIVSDLIEWSATLEARAPDRTAAYKSLRGADRSHDRVPRRRRASSPTRSSRSRRRFEEEIETVEELKVLPGAKEPMRIEKKIPKGFVTTPDDLRALAGRHADREGVARGHLAARGGRLDHVGRARVLLHAARRAQGRDARGRRQGRACAAIWSISPPSLAGHDRHCFP